MCYVLPENAGDAEFDQSNYSVVEISSADEGWTLPMDDPEYLRTGNTKSGTPAQLDVGSKKYAFNVVTNKVSSLDGFAPDENAIHSSVTTITNTRTGWVDAMLTKEWKMGSDAVNARLRLFEGLGGSFTGVGFDFIQNAFYVHIASPN